MKIFYDSQAFDMQKYGGITNYYYHLIKELRKTDNEVKIGVLATDNEYLWNFNILSVNNFYNTLLHNNINIENFRNIKLVNLLYGMNLLKNTNYDILHLTFFYEGEYYDYFCENNINQKTVITVHDLIPEIYNWENGNNIQIQTRKKIITLADAIICPSENTKNDILKYYPNVKEERIHVIHHGIEENVNIEYKKVLDSPYILYIGGRGDYKGWEKFLKNSRNFMVNHPEYKIFASGESLSKEELEYIDSLGLTGRIIAFYVNEDTLPHLYNNALCFVFPSEYEGFGLPILEAWQHKCITLLNDIPVFKEIGGNISKYFNINKDNELSEKLEEIYNLNPNKKQLLINKQTKKLKEYSWKKSAEEHLKVYKSIL